MTTLAEAVADSKTRLAAAGIADASFEARLLVGRLLGLSGTEVFTGGDRALSESDLLLIEDAVRRRLTREPLHRILGSREFFGLDLKISSETLEPRPDTEILVDCVMDHVRRIVAAKAQARIIDLGTGTGAIALALLDMEPSAHALGTDISAGALRIARENATRLGLAERFETVQSRWFEAIDGRFDIIVSNPPYIRTDVIPTLDPEVREFDPPAALDGGLDGLDAYRAIAAGAEDFLEADGVVAVEIGFDQKQAVADLFEESGFSLVEARRDYGGNDRVLVFGRK